MVDYSADPVDFIKAFPPRIAEPPAQLLAFAGWLATRPWGSVGSFDLTAGWSDHNLFGGERFYDQFALFIRMPDGGRAGYWLKDAATVEGAPIVWLGSEGDYATLAPDLPGLIARLATADFPAKGPGADFLPNQFGDAPNLRGELAAWLGARLGPGGVGRLKSSRPGADDAFLRWVGTDGAAPEREMAVDRDLAAIAKILEPYRPPPTANEWTTTSIWIGWAGDHVEIVNASGGHVALQETPALLPHLGALRQAAAKRTPGIGLWHGAWFNLSRDGAAQIMTDYLYEPKFFHGRPPADAFRADQTNAPRTPRRVPAWLATILA